MLLNFDTPASRFRLANNLPANPTALSTLAFAITDKLGNIVAKALDGSLIFTPAARGSINGFIFNRGPVSRKTTATAMTDTATISAAGMIGGLIVANPTAAANYTTPTGAVLAAALPADFTVGDAVEFAIVNVATNAAFDITVLAGASGITLAGNMVVESNSASTVRSAAIFRAVCTAASTFTIYRIA